MLFRRCPFSGFNLTVNGNPEVKKTWTFILKLLLYSLQAVFIEIPMVRVSIQINIHTVLDNLFVFIVVSQSLSVLLCTKIKTSQMWSWYRNVTNSLGSDCALKSWTVFLFSTVFARLRLKVSHVWWIVAVCCAVWCRNASLYHLHVSSHWLQDCVYQVQEEGNYFMNRNYFYLNRKKELDFVFAGTLFIVKTTVYLLLKCIIYPLS